MFFVKNQTFACHIQRNLPFHLLFHCTQYCHHQADLEFCHLLELCNRKTWLFNFPLLKFDIFQCNICNNYLNQIYLGIDLYKKEMYRLTLRI